MDTSSPWPAYDQKIASARSIQEIEAIEHGLFGRKSGAMTLALQAIHSLSAEEKKTQAKDLNEYKKKFEQAIEEKRTALAASAGAGLKDQDPIDISLELPPAHHGHLHPIPEFIRRVEEVFGRMGFDVARGPEIESEELNFDLLNIPPDHPARDTQDTFWIDKKKRLVLRTQTSPVQIRYMREHKPPFRMICPGKCYRKDDDATHSPMFHQFEGVMVGENVSLANLKMMLITAIRELIDPDAEFRFRTGYFPFTEPSMEVDMRWRGDEAKSREGRWLEILGCGMINPTVLKNAGVDSNKWQGFAFGAGIERMIMIKNQIPDLRSFYQGDLRFLNQF